MTDTTDSGAGQRYQSFYEQTAVRHNIWTAPRRSDLYFREIIRYDHLLSAVPKDAARVLDLGCGDGYLSVALARRGQKVTALDLSSNRLEKFADKAADLGITQVQAAADSTGLDAGSFDAVVASELIEHLPEPKSTLAEVHRLLAPGGAFVVCVPNREKIRQVTCPHCLKKFSTDGHLHSFSAESLGDLLRESGLEPIRSVTFRNSRTERVRSAFVSLPYGFWIRWMDAFFSRTRRDLDRYLAVVARRPAG